MLWIDTVHGKVWDLRDNSMRYSEEHLRMLDWRPIDEVSKDEIVHVLAMLSERCTCD